MVHNVINIIAKLIQKKLRFYSFELIFLVIINLNILSRLMLSIIASLPALKVYYLSNEESKY